MFLFVLRKNICTVSFPDVRELLFFKHFDGKCQYISVYLSKKIFVSKTYKILSGGIGGWGRLNNFLKAACCLALVKWLTIFHFN